MGSKVVKFRVIQLGQVEAYSEIVQRVINGSNPDIETRK